jgi:hypothetical protein
MSKTLSVESDFYVAVNGDYRVKPGSPALKLGFESFDISGAGLTADFPKQWLDAGAPII